MAKQYKKGKLSTQSHGFGRKKCQLPYLPYDFAVKFGWVEGLDHIVVHA